MRFFITFNTFWNFFQRRSRNPDSSKMKLFATITEPLTHIIIRFPSYTYVTGFLHPNMISINSILSSVWEHILQCKSIGLISIWYEFFMKGVSEQALIGMLRFSD